MAILMDVVIVAILLLNIIIGYKKGLVKAIVSIVAFLIAIIATLILYRPVSNFIINNTELDDKIKEVIINNNDENTEEEESTSNKGIDILNQMQETADETKEYAIEVMADNIAIQAIQILTAIILFFAIRIIVALLKFLTDGLANLPLIKQFNQVGGILYGVIKGLIIVYLLLTILFFVISINGNGIISNAVDNSYITKFLYENNLIVKYCLLGNNLV